MWGPGVIGEIFYENTESTTNLLDIRLCGGRSVRILRDLLSILHGLLMSVCLSRVVCMESPFANLCSIFEPFKPTRNPSKSL